MAASEVMEQPQRKHVRLRDYDYGQNGAYFVTICTQGRRCVLSEISSLVGPDALIGPHAALTLTEIGQIVEGYIQSTEAAYETVKIEHYVIMPNHIHLLVRLTNGGPMRASGPTLSTVVKALKGLVTRKLGYKIWQNGYHEHIIRDDNDFLNHWQYIDNNPARWAEDEYFGGSF